MICAKLKRKSRLKQRSDRQIIVEELDKLFHDILVLERGAVDEIDGRPGNRLGVFHILPKGGHPRLRYHRQNALLVNWMPYHHSWHHDNPGNKNYDKVMSTIVKKLGEDYITTLCRIEVVQPKLTLHYLMILRAALTQELEGLKQQKESPDGK